MFFTRLLDVDCVSYTREHVYENMLLDSTLLHTRKNVRLYMNTHTHTGVHTHIHDAGTIVLHELVETGAAGGFQATASGA